MRQLLSIGMDGPNVNFKLMDLLQKEHAELHGGAQIISVGSRGLHTLHNAMKAGFTAWQLGKTPARDAFSIPQCSCPERGIHQPHRVLLLSHSFLQL